MSRRDMRPDEAFEMHLLRATAAMSLGVFVMSVTRIWQLAELGDDILADLGGDE